MIPVPGSLEVSESLPATRTSYHSRGHGKIEMPALGCFTRRDFGVRCVRLLRLITLPQDQFEEREVAMPAVERLGASVWVASLFALRFRMRSSPGVRSRTYDKCCGLEEEVPPIDEDVANRLVVRYQAPGPWEQLRDICVRFYRRCVL